MPPRFVEVVDVGAEATSTLASLLERGYALSDHLGWQNITSYLTRNDSLNILNTLHYYNVSLDALPAQLHAAIVNANASFTDVGQYAPPPGRARTYMLVALLLVVTREVFVRWSVKRVLKQHGLHRH